MFYFSCANGPVNPWGDNINRDSLHFQVGSLTDIRPNISRILAILKRDYDHTLRATLHLNLGRWDNNFILGEYIHSLNVEGVMDKLGRLTRSNGSIDVNGDHTIDVLTFGTSVKGGVPISEQMKLIK